MSLGSYRRTPAVARALSLGALACAAMVTLGACGTHTHSNVSSRHASTRASTSAPAAGSSTGASAEPKAPPTITAVTPAAARLATRRRDYPDRDNDASGEDDYPILHFGHAATPAQQRSIATLVKRFFEAAATENGAAACPLMHPVVAESLAEEDGAQFGLAHATCAPVISKLFALRHRQITNELTSFRLIGVRIEGEKALELFAVADTPEPRKLELHAYGASWKVWTVFDTGMP